MRGGRGSPGLPTLHPCCPDLARSPAVPGGKGQDGACAQGGRGLTARRQGHQGLGGTLLLCLLPFTASQGPPCPFLHLREGPSEAWPCLPRGAAARASPGRCDDVIGPHISCCSSTSLSPPTKPSLGVSSPGERDGVPILACGGNITNGLKTGSRGPWPVWLS